LAEKNEKIRACKRALGVLGGIMGLELLKVFRVC